MRFETLESRMLLSGDVFQPQISREQAVAFERGLAQWVNAAVAVDQMNTEAVPANFGMAVDAGATVPWVVVQWGRQATVEGLATTTPFATGQAAGLSVSPSTYGGATNWGGAGQASGWQNSSQSQNQDSTGGSSSGASSTTAADSGTGSMMASEPSPAPDMTVIHATAIPSVQAVTYDSALNDQHPSESVQIPIGPDTRGLSLAFRSGDVPSGGGLVAFLQQIMVQDSSGDTIAQAVPDLPMGGFSPEALALALQNAPVGGRLIVQISSSASIASADSGTNLTASGPWSVPFALEVLRQDSQSVSTAATGDLVQGSFSVGTMALASIGLTGAGALNSSEPATTPDPGAPLLDVTTAQASPPAAFDTESNPSSDGWLPIGPLVSRSAGPLGLVLASITAEPTPGVDRAERAFSEDPDQADPTPERIVGRGVDSWRPDQTDTVDRDASPGVVVVARGDGLLPLYATSRGPRRPGDAALLLKGAELDSMPTLVVSGAGFPVPADTRSATAERREAADVIRAALGLVVGLSLTTGPLFSDLLAQARSTARLRAHAPAGTPSAGKPRARKTRLAAWFTSLFA